MPGTRTAPTVDGNETFKRLSITVYDYTGEQRTDSYKIDAASTDIQIEALVAAYQAISNATVWRVQVSDVYNSIGDPSNALEEVWEEASANLVLLAKDANDDSANVFVPAPVNSIFEEGTENIDPASVPLGDLMTAYLAVKAGYQFVSGRFTSRRDVGTKVNF